MRKPILCLVIAFLVSACGFENKDISDQSFNSNQVKSLTSQQEFEDKIIEVLAYFVVIDSEIPDVSNMTEEEALDFYLLSPSKLEIEIDLELLSDWKTSNGMNDKEFSDEINGIFYSYYAIADRAELLGDNEQAINPGGTPCFDGWYDSMLLATGGLALGYAVSIITGNPLPAVIATGTYLAAIEVADRSYCNCLISNHGTTGAGSDC